MTRSDYGSSISFTYNNEGSRRRGGIEYLKEDHVKKIFIIVCLIISFILVLAIQIIMKNIRKLIINV